MRTFCLTAVFASLTLATALGQRARDGFDPNVDGVVYAMAVQENGKIIIGGNFTTVGGVARNNLARLNVDGTLDTSFTTATGVSQEVACLAVQADGKIVVGGYFISIGGIARTNLARLNPNGTVDIAFRADTDNEVYSLLALSNGDILFGGEFIQVGAFRFHHLARVLANGNVDPTFNPGPDNAVWDIALQPDGRFLIVGEFNNVGGQTRAKIARLNANGSLDGTFLPMTSGWTFGVAVQADRNIVVGGVFTLINGQPRLRLARLHPDGSLDPTFTPAASGFVYTVALQQDGRILVGGDFETLAGQERKRLGRLNPDGTLDAEFDAPATVMQPSFVESVRCLRVQPDGKILVGGSFTNLSGHLRNHIGRLYSDGSVDAHFAPRATPNEVLAMALQPDGHLVVGGFFTNLAGQSRFGLGRLGVDGTLDAGMNFEGNRSVGSLAVQADGSVLVGVFGAVLVDPPAFLMRFGPDGEFDNTFTSYANSSISCLAVQADGKTLVGGFFTEFAGQPRQYLVRLNVDGSLDASFNPNPSDIVFCVAVQADGRILVGGAFESLAGQPRGYLGRLHPDGTLDTTFNPATFGYTLALALQANGQILARGSFESPAQIPPLSSEFARLNQDGSRDTNFHPNIDFPPVSILVQTDGDIVLGGQFTNSAGVPIRNLARLHSDGTWDTNYAPQAVRLNSSRDEAVWALAGMPDGKTLVGGAFDHLAGEVRYGLGRLTSGGTARQSIAIDNGGTEVRWKRSGTGPEVEQVTVEISDDGMNYSLLGHATRQSGGWLLAGLSLPEEALFYIRARGRTSGGYFNGSSGIIESVAPFWRLPQPFLSNMQVLDGGAFQFSFANPHVVAFRVLASTNIAAAEATWESLGAPIPLGNGVYQIKDSTAPSHARRFYQLRSP